jgi:inhibitor of cysteine peptidase
VAILKVGREDNGKLIKPRQGDVIIVSLQETPTTGYRWAVDPIDEKILELKDEGFRIAPEAGIGRSGTRTFTFRVIAAGSVQLQMKLRREWLGDASIIERYGLTIEVLQ